MIDFSKLKCQYDLTLQSKHVFGQEFVKCTVYVPKHQKVFMCLDQNSDSLRSFHIKSKTICTPIIIDFLIYDIKTDSKNEKLYLLANKTFCILKIEPCQMLRNIQIPDSQIQCFFFTSEDCSNVLLNSEKTGLLNLDIKTSIVTPLKIRVFRYSFLNSMSMSSCKRVLYGILENFTAGCLDLKRNFKLKINKKCADNFNSIAQFLSWNNRVLFTGSLWGNFMMNDTRSSKFLRLYQFEEAEGIYEVKVTKNFVCCGTREGNFLVIRDFYPFKIISHLKIENDIRKIIITDTLFIIQVWGKNCIFKIFSKIRLKQSRESLSYF